MTPSAVLGLGCPHGSAGSRHGVLSIRLQLWLSRQPHGHSRLLSLHTGRVTAVSGWPLCAWFSHLGKGQVTGRGSCAWSRHPGNSTPPHRDPHPGGHVIPQDFCPSPPVEDCTLAPVAIKCGQGFAPPLSWKRLDQLLSCQDPFSFLPALLGGAGPASASLRLRWDGSARPGAGRDSAGIAEAPSFPSPLAGEAAETSSPTAQMGKARVRATAHSHGWGRPRLGLTPCALPRPSGCPPPRRPSQSGRSLGALPGGEGCGPQCSAPGTAAGTQSALNGCWWHGRPGGCLPWAESGQQAP